MEMFFEMLRVSLHPVQLTWWRIYHNNARIVWFLYSKEIAVTIGLSYPIQASGIGIIVSLKVFARCASEVSFFAGRGGGM